VGAKAFCKLLIADSIVDFLEDQEAKYVFGVPGSTIVSLISAISNSKKLNFISALNENASLGMADGYARASGRFATAVLHTTPGLCTALPNLYNSFVDRVPLLILVGDVNSKALIKQPGLSLDRLEDLVRPLSVWSYYAKSPSDVVTAMSRSASILNSVQPGPCCIIIPEDILEQSVPNGTKLQHLQKEKSFIVPDQALISELASLIDNATWPVLIVGREIHDEASIQSLAEFCERVKVPVLLESPYPSAYGMSFPQDGACYLGLFRRESEVLKEVDLIVGLGGQLLTERKYYEEEPFDHGTKVVHVHANPRELGKNVKTDISILGTPDRAVIMLNEASKRLKQNAGRAHRAARIGQIRSKRASEREKLASEPGDGSGIKPWTLVSALNKILNDGDLDYTIVDEGVVTSSYLSELFMFAKPGSLIGRSAGCLGWGVNAAVGAKLALPNRKLIAFVGDGALLFCPQGLWTAAHYKIPVTVVVCDNSGYSSVDLSYESFRKRSGSKSASNEGTKIIAPKVDIAKLADSLGLQSVSITREEDLAPLILKSVSKDSLQLLDVHIDAKEKGYEGSVGQNSAWT
jgi:benzoylformate decarboxylase